jgi:hypothetical protein
VAPSPLFPGFLQLNNEYFTRRSAQIRLRRQQLPTSFPKLDQFFVRHALQRKIPYLLIWKSRSDGTVKEAARIAPATFSYLGSLLRRRFSV